jgi:hypothetical protein
MADITMCSGDNCKIKDSCYRYTAKRSFWQSMFKTPPLKEDGTCEMFWGDNADYIYGQLKEIVKDDK